MEKKLKSTDRCQTEYIVIGTLEDVQAHDFLTVQIDLNTRKKWDSYIKKLEWIYHDQETKTELIEWVMSNPTLRSIIIV
ncbi:hypothetical protein MXB_130 [Myxobolus squamalis]|nr:hypothetical protein MXB_130 [Myxobolus squamalis]